MNNPKITITKNISSINLLPNEEITIIITNENNQNLGTITINHTKNGKILIQSNDKKGTQENIIHKQWEGQYSHKQLIKDLENN